MAARTAVAWLHAGIKRNILSLSFLGFSVFKPRCAVPYPKPCLPKAGGQRRLATSDSEGAAASNDEADVCMPFNFQVFQKEQIFFQIQFTVVVVVSV